ncbi:MAG: hypothetical protein ABIE23_01180 [archaeon]
MDLGFGDTKRLREMARRKRSKNRGLMGAEFEKQKANCFLN